MTYPRGKRLQTVKYCSIFSAKDKQQLGLVGLLPRISHLLSDPHSLLSVDILLERSGCGKAVGTHAGLSPWQHVLRFLGSRCHQPCAKQDSPAELARWEQLGQNLPLGN